MEEEEGGEEGRRRERRSRRRRRRRRVSSRRKVKQEEEGGEGRRRGGGKGCKRKDADLPQRGILKLAILAETVRSNEHRDVQHLAIGHETLPEAVLEGGPRGGHQVGGGRLCGERARMDPWRSPS